MRTLISLYKQNKIAYPRVENSYIKKNLYSYFPHPELSRINAFFEPLKKAEYQYDENSLLLHLHNLRYINISQVVSTKKNIKKISDNKNTFSKILDFYKKSVFEKGETRLDYFLDFNKKHYSTKKPKFLRFSIKKKYFLDQIQELHEEIINKQNKEKTDYHEKLFIANQDKNKYNQLK